MATRPKTLIASLSPIFIGTCLALRAGHFNPLIFLFTLLTGLGIQILTNYANDLYDFLKAADTSARKGPIRVTQAGLVTVPQMRTATLLITLLTALTGSVLIYRGGAVIGLLVILALLCAWGYTAGPIPLSYLGIAEIFVLVFFGPIATLSTYYLQTLSLSYIPLIAGLSPGLISCALLTTNNLRDVEEDNVASKKTLVVRFGTLFGKMEYVLSMLLAVFLPLLLYPQFPFILLTQICLIPAVYLCKQVFTNNDPYTYIKLLEQTGKFLVLFTVIFVVATLL